MDDEGLAPEDGDLPSEKEESWTDVVADLLGGIAGTLGRDHELRSKILEGLNAAPNEGPQGGDARVALIVDLQKRLKKLEARVKKLERASKK